MSLLNKIYITTLGVALISAIATLYTPSFIEVVLLLALILICKDKLFATVLALSGAITFYVAGYAEFNFVISLVVLSLIALRGARFVYNKLYNQAIALFFLSALVICASLIITTTQIPTESFQFGVASIAVTYISLPLVLLSRMKPRIVKETFENFFE